MPQRTLRITGLSAGYAQTSVAVAAAGVTGVSDSWQTAVIAAFAAAALLATGIRFSAHAAVALLLVVAALAVGGHAAADSHRPVAPRVVHPAGR